MYVIYVNIIEDMCCMCMDGIKRLHKCKKISINCRHIILYEKCVIGRNHITF